MTHAFRLVLAVGLAGTPALADTFSPPEVGVQPFSSGIWMRGSTGGLDFQDRYNRLSDGDDSFGLEDGDLRSSASGAQSTGSVGALAQTPAGADFRFATTDVALFDVITFDFGADTTREVSFQLALSGMLSNLGATNGLAIGGGGVQIADVTGLDQSFFFGGDTANPLGGLLVPNGEDVFASGSFQIALPDDVANVRGGLAVISANLEDDVESGSFGIGVADEYVVDESGQAQMLDRVLTGSFTAQAGATYALLVTAQAVASQAGVTADISSTATFAFTDLGGGVFSSASGVLPGTGESIGAPPSIPLPPSALALAAAVGTLLLRGPARRRG